MSQQHGMGRSGEQRSPRAHPRPYIKALWPGKRPTRAASVFLSSPFRGGAESHCYLLRCSAVPLCLTALSVLHSSEFSSTTGRSEVGVAILDSN